MLIPAAVVYMTAIFIVGCLFVIINAITILSGTGLWGLIGENEKDTEEKPTMLWRFPSIPVGTRRVSIRAIVLSLYALLLVATLAYFYQWTALRYAGLGVGGLVALVFLFVAVGAIGNGFRTVGRWGGWALFKAYIKAKKEGICPIITFDEPDDPVFAKVGKPKTD